MARQISTRKCSICSRIVPKETVQTLGGKNYCEECYKRHEEEKQAYKDLSDYIYDLADYDPTIFPLVGSQIKRLKEEEGLTNVLILSTLKYMYDLKEPKMNFVPEYGVANLPYFFREAQLFYQQHAHLSSVEEQKIQESSQCASIQITLKRSDLIKKQKEFEEKRKEQNNVNLINLDEINIEDDGELFIDKDIINYKNKLDYKQKHKYKENKYEWEESD